MITHYVRFMKVGKTKEQIYTIYCSTCKKDNGVRFTGPNLPKLPKKPYINCVWCGSNKVKYKKIKELFYD